MTVESCAKLRQDLGLDRPMYVQYGKWLSHFARGDWGKSLLSNRPVLPDIRSALANTAVLGLVAIAFSLLTGIGIGLYSSLRQYSWFDHVATGGAFFGLSIPNFWFALVLQMLFGVYLTKWLHLTEPIFYTAGLTKPGSRGSTCSTDCVTWCCRCSSCRYRSSPTTAGISGPPCWRCCTATIFGRPGPRASRSAG